MTDFADLRDELESRTGPGMLPGRAYTSREVLAWELRKVFAASWACLGRLDELVSGGTTQRSVVVGDVAAVLTVLGEELVSAHPDYVMTHRLTPLAPDLTRVECAWYFPPGEGGRLPDPAYAVEFWDLTNRQDWAACESVQRGLTSPHFRPGPLAPGEDAVARFDAMLAEAYLRRGLGTARS